MGYLIARLLAAVAAMAIGGLLGLVAAAPSHAPLPGALAGAAIGAAAVVAVDALRAARLLRWLRGPQDAPAPRDPGLWGEIGYRAERAVRRLEHDVALERTRLSQLLSAIDASPNGVLLLDAADRIEWCNGVAADHFGLDPQRDRAQRATNLVRAPAFVGHLRQGIWDEPVTLTAPSGKGLLSVLVRPYGDAGHKLVLSLDITEREQADAMRRDFVANVSHEIRTPLTVLGGFIETLDQLPLAEVERRRVLALMGQQASRMQALVGDLLTLATLEGSPRPPADRWVSVSHLFALAQTDATALSAGRHRLCFRCGETAQLAGNETELASAVANLVNNAVRYTPQGGRIDVAWSLLADGRGEIAVADNGIGIEREHLARLTERFYRVDGSRSRDTGGTGLGLSIVKHVVQRHGGALDVRSVLGQGSCFRLSFPAARVRCAGPDSDPPAPAASSVAVNG